MLQVIFRKQSYIGDIYESAFFRPTV